MSELLRHPGKRFIVGGASLHVHALDPALLDTGVVIGLNRWPALGLRLDYWLCCDTDLAMRDYPELVHSVAAPRFMQAYDHVPDAPADIWFRKEREYIPATWEGKLAWSATSACAAVNLAGIMGASEVLLYGVDLIPGGRADGSEYETADHWAQYVGAVSVWLQKASVLFGMPVYRLNPDSPLALPLYVQ